MQVCDGCGLVGSFLIDGGIFQNQKKNIKNQKRLNIDQSIKYEQKKNKRTQGERRTALACLAKCESNTSAIKCVFFFFLVQYCVCISCDIGHRQIRLNNRIMKNHNKMYGNNAMCAPAQLHSTETKIKKKKKRKSTVDVEAGTTRTIVRSNNKKTRPK